MWYRLEIEYIEHTKAVLTIDDYLGDIAGIYELLIYINLFIFGNYINYLTKISWI